MYMYEYDVIANSVRISIQSNNKLFTQAKYQSRHQYLYTNHHQGDEHLENKEIKNDFCHQAHEEYRGLFEDDMCIKIIESFKTR